MLLSFDYIFGNCRYLLWEISAVSGMLTQEGVAMNVLQWIK